MNGMKKLVVGQTDLSCHLKAPTPYESSFLRKRINEVRSDIEVIDLALDDVTSDEATARESATQLKHKKNLLQREIRESIAHVALLKSFPRIDFSFLRTNRIIFQRGGNELWLPKFTFHKCTNYPPPFKVVFFQGKYVHFSDPPLRMSFVLDELAKGTEFFNQSGYFRRLENAGLKSEFSKRRLPHTFPYFFVFDNVPVKIQKKYGGSERKLTVYKRVFKSQLSEGIAHAIATCRNCIKDALEDQGEEYNPNIFLPYIVAETQPMDWSIKIGGNDVFIVGIVGEEAYLVDQASL